MVLFSLAILVQRLAPILVLMQRRPRPELIWATLVHACLLQSDMDSLAADRTGDVTLWRSTVLSSCRSPLHTRRVDYVKMVLHCLREDS